MRLTTEDRRCLRNNECYLGGCPSTTPWAMSLFFQPLGLFRSNVNVSKLEYAS